MTKTTIAALVGTLAFALTAVVMARVYAPQLLPAALRPGSVSLATGPKPPSGDRSANVPGATVAVEAQAARRETTSADIRTIGSLRSDESVQVASEIAGIISEITFKEGQAVKSGDVIVRLDEALVKAEVTDTESRLKLAKQNRDRAVTLSRSNTVTGRTLDESLSNFDTATAAYELARTRLAKHTLRAPFDGIAGVRSVSIGAYVPIGTAIVNIEKIDVLKVDFKVPEVFLTDISIGQTVDVTVDAVPGETFQGEIYAIDPLVDVNGRALTVRARLANKGGVLRPGLFARIVIKGLTEKSVTVLPESAIVPRGTESFVYRIDGGKAVEARVKLGERRDAEVEILEGLDASSVVVTAGQQKLRNGSAVEIIAAPVARDGATAPATGADTPASTSIEGRRG